MGALARRREPSVSGVFGVLVVSKCASLAKTQREVKLVLLFATKRVEVC